MNQELWTTLRQLAILAGFLIVMRRTVGVWKYASPRGRMFIPIMVFISATWAVFYMMLVLGMPPDAWQIQVAATVGMVTLILTLWSANGAIKDAGIERKETDALIKELRRMRAANGST